MRIKKTQLTAYTFPQRLLALISDTSASIMEAVEVTKKGS
jgi:hypothetical protein